MASPRASFSSGVVLALLLTHLTPVASSQSPPRPIDFETVFKSFSSGHLEPARYVITSREQWEEVWRLTMSNGFPIPAAPVIDFEQNSVIAVFQGNQPSSGYSISVTKIVKSGRNIKVHVKETRPADSCMVLAVLTQPGHIVVTEKIRHPDRVSFREKLHIKRCE
jgi:hypothetical protein